MNTSLSRQPRLERYAKKRMEGREVASFGAPRPSRYPRTRSGYGSEILLLAEQVARLRADVRPRTPFG